MEMGDDLESMMDLYRHMLSDLLDDPTIEVRVEVKVLRKFMAYKLLVISATRSCVIKVGNFDKKVALLKYLSEKCM